MKNENKKLIIWVIIAFVIGTIIGGFLISPTTIGNAKNILFKNQKSYSDLYDENNKLIYNENTDIYYEYKTNPDKFKKEDLESITLSIEKAFDKLKDEHPNTDEKSIIETYTYICGHCRHNNTEQNCYATNLKMVGFTIIRGSCYNNSCNNCTISDYQHY
jgi:hypothetical protein